MEKVSYKGLQGIWKHDSKSEEKWKIFCGDLKLRQDTVFLNISFEKKICFLYEYDKMVITYNFDNDKINIEEVKKKILKNIFKKVN